MIERPTSVDMVAVGRLVDERAIQSVLFRYAEALDRKDWDMLATCFLPSAIGHYDMIGHLDGYPAIEKVCRKALEPLSQTQHLIGNVQIVVDTAQAQSTCYFHAQHVRKDFPGGDMNIIAGRYDDKFVRTEQGWRIHERKLTVQWTSGNSAIHELDVES